MSDREKNMNLVPLGRAGDGYEKKANSLYELFQLYF